MNSIYMNHYVNIMHSFKEKGKDDIPTDEELLLFSESEDEEKELKKPKKNSKSAVVIGLRIVNFNGSKRLTIILLLVIKE